MTSKVGLATVYGAGLSKIAPGTMGSLVAAVLAYPILLLPHGPRWLLVGVILSTLLGTRSSTRYMATHDVGHDPSEIVIDEVAGQWLTYSLMHLFIIIAAGNLQDGNLVLQGMAASPLFLGLGFLLFRLFDILKPWPISVADRKVKGGFGVMFDDLLAAIPAGVILYLLYRYVPILAAHA